MKEYQYILTFISIFLLQVTRSVDQYSVVQDGILKTVF